MLIADESFSHIDVKHVGEVSLTRGIAAFQFIPGTGDQLIVALKSEEDKGIVASYVMIFDVDGKIIMPETKLEGDYKFEGIEFS
jgi:soluble calcium-activated nucleotidase 1